MNVSGGNAIKPVKYLFHIFSLYPNSVIFYPYNDFVTFVPGTNHQYRRHIFSFVLQCIVEQIKEHVGKVHFVDIDHRIFCLQVDIEFSIEFFYLQYMGVGHIYNDIIQIYFLNFQCGFLFIEQRHLQYLFYLKTQSFCFVVYHTCHVFEYFGRFGDGFVLQHL
ncbi:hypothetical protein SDC9_82616 [bioreactor metagenome]|uniref:Uncharacterized protein n=1 Tax=bioreactor metagenome TaxID=1076179 RepID=A0A644Z7P0_9ZZZZ